MRKLSREQQQSILDFYFRCGEPEEINAGRDLIASNSEAAKLYADLESTLTDLDHVKYDVCPDNLVDLTVARLKLLAKRPEAPNSQLHQLLEKERNSLNESTPEIAYKPQPPYEPGGRGHTIRPIFELFAAAASIAIVAGIFFPGFSFLRAHSRQMSCARNLGRIGAAFASFSEDNQDQLAAARVKEGAPWWKIGVQGLANESNTRVPFMLIKLGYVNGDVFVCKGYKEARPLRCDSSSIAGMNDFQSRHNVNYSFPLSCPKSTNPLKPSQNIMAGDLNPVFVPVFERIPCDPGFYEKMDEFERVLINDEVKKMMSKNHGGKGQNLLYYDGGVKYISDRIVDGDDIFTVRGVDAYTGCEMPSVENDTFLAP